jgi:hypothetical protein
MKPVYFSFIEFDKLSSEWLKSNKLSVDFMHGLGIASCGYDPVRRLWYMDEQDWVMFLLRWS